MIKGTTPTHTFILPFDVANIKQCKVTYAQNDSEVLSKNAVDCTLTENKIIVELTQEDTLKFDASQNVQIQLRVLTQEDKALASKIAVRPVYKVLNNEVMSSET